MYTKRIVIIAAGGKGSRMKSNMPKQYLVLADKPVLMHTIDLFKDIVDKIIVVVHPEMISYWQQECIKYQFTVSHEIVAGGITRFQSVQNGFNYLAEKYSEVFEKGYCIAIHDAARPLTDKVLIEKSFDLAANGFCNVLAVQSSNSIRLGNKTQSSSIDRDQVWQIQTPQTFPSEVLKEAFSQEESALFTDDASVVEKIGYPIHLLESNPKNIKITYPEDLEIAKLYLKICD